MQSQLLVILYILIRHDTLLTYVIFFHIFFNARWYKDHDLASNLPPYYRDRIVELHFFVIAMYFEPKFSRARIMLTKFFKVVTILDDTCDRYASISEAESLVNSLERYNT